MFDILFDNRFLEMLRRLRFFSFLIFVGMDLVRWLLDILSLIDKVEILKIYEGIFLLLRLFFKRFKVSRLL